MSPSRNVIAFFVASIAFVGVAAALKMSQMPLENVHPLTYTPHAPAKAPELDSEFLETPKPSEVVPAKIVVMQTNAAPTTPAAPTDPVTADAYIVGDVSTGKIYFQKNQLMVLPFASMSKIITAVAATDMYKASTTITITDMETKVPADMSQLKAGETFTLKELLYPMLLNSSNVAAEAIASSSDRMNFLEQMSGYAWEIGMPHSFFADPTGLSPKNAGTASGFFAMARYLYSTRPDILALTRVASTSVATTTEHGSHVFTSIHPFVGDPRFIGGKTGHTPEALDTMLTIMRIANRPIAIIVLHSSEGRAKDTQALIDRVTKVLK